MRKIIILLTVCLLFKFNVLKAQVQWANKVIDFSSEYKDDVIRNNSTRWSASQVLGYPNSLKYASSQLAWTPLKQDGGKEFITVGFSTPQMVQQVIVGENFNAGSITEIILYDNNGKKYTAYENEHPQPVQKFDDVLSYFKTKPTYNVVKLKLVINTAAVFGRQEIDCIGISSTTALYKQVVNVVKYSEPVGQPENLGANINSEYYDHLPLISPDGSLLYFTRKLTDEKNARYFNDDIYFSHILPNGKFSKAENIGPPLNTSDNNFVCFISHDNSRLYVANKYIKNTYNYAGLSVSNKQKDGTWSKPKTINIPDLYNKNEFAHYHMNLDETIILMAIQRDDSYGDLDLYVSRKYSDGSWSVPLNLGPVINTVGSEGSVFLAADGKTLYFSSSGHPGYGSYDMYMSKRLDETWTNWSKPLNLGDKINTDEMDIYYTIPAAGDYAYFSSGLTMYGKNDLYRIKLPKEARPEYVDIKKFVANAPLKKDAPVIPTTTTVNTTTTIPTATNTTAAVTPPKPLAVTQSPVNTPLATSSQTDDLQRKLEELKKQQLATNSPANTTIKTEVNQPAITPPRNDKREVVNQITPYQTKEEQRPKPPTTNTIKPVEMPKPGPTILTQEELKAREQQKVNPTINPNADNLNAITKRPMTDEPVAVSPVVPPPSIQRYQNPNIITTEVDTKNTGVPDDVPTSVLPNANTLKTSNPQTDELQQKLEDLKRQQVQAKISSPTAINTTAPTQYKSISEQYPNPQPIVTTSSTKTDNLQQKLDALKAQQSNVSQSNKLYANPYETKPYSPQPVKEQQVDVGGQKYDEYQQKLEALKQQQNQVIAPVVAPTPTPSPIAVANKEETAVKKETLPSTVVAATNPIITKYEEKLKKLKEEMATLPSVTLPTNTKPEVIAPQNTNNTPTVSSSTVLNTDAKYEQPIAVSPVNSQQNQVVPEDSLTNTSVTNDSKSTVLYNEKAKLDSIQQAQKIAEQKMEETLDKMGSSKLSLEKDIADLKDQRQKFSTEKDKLTAQNTQLSGEKDKLEAEKKKMDDLLAQMQAERDKLAAEKKKMEDDKAKLDALKKQQEKDVLALKRSIDSLSKIQLKTANTVQQNYDLFNVPLQVGAVAQVNNIYFVADAAFLQIPSYPELDKVVLFLARNKTLKVEIGGHTNGLCDDYFCQKLSTSRAKTCVDYLISKGISADRLSYKGYGKTQLLLPNEPSNPLNQRVEIKILSVN